jgi:CO/xanthine dehydrogenase Mo-binding subunit
MPGVRAIITGEDVRGLRVGRRLLDAPILAWDRVLFVGDRLAAAAADTPEQAEAAVREIDVDLEALPPVLDMSAAIAPGAALLHPDAASYRMLGGPRPVVPHPNIQGNVHLRRGSADPEELLAAADRTFEHRYRTARQHHGSIEPHSALVWFDDEDRVHVAATSKDPFGLRTQLAIAFDLSPKAVVVHSWFIGGDFGGKGYAIDEYSLVLQARATGRPVRIILLPPVAGPGSFGAKGIGETVNCVVAPAVANAVADATGVRVRELPITAERILAALHRRSS